MSFSIMVKRPPPTSGAASIGSRQILLRKQSSCQSALCSFEHNARPEIHVRFRYFGQMKNYLATVII